MPYFGGLVSSKAWSEAWSETCILGWRFSRMFSLLSRVNRMVIPAHRYIGLLYLLQLAASIVLVAADFNLFLRTPLWFTMPLCGMLQACSASWYFRHNTPKKMDPGFMSMGDVGRLSWFFVCENIFYSSLLLFQNCYFHPAIIALGAGAEPGSLLSIVLAIIEALFVFMPYFWRPLFPKTALRDSHRHREKNTAEENLDFYTKNTVVVKVFYNFAKHYIGFFLNYVTFLGRVAPLSPEHHVLYAVEVVGGYMSTGGIFIHTMVFKNIFSNKVGALLYQAGYPFTIYFYYKMIATVIVPNLDLTILAFVGLCLNFLPNLAYFHTFQAVLMCVFYVWRKVMVGQESNFISPANVQVFLKELPGTLAGISLLALGLLAATGLTCVVLAPKFPKWARQVNPFYKCARRLKKERPHPEDDPPSGKED